MRLIFAAASLLALAACGMNGTDRYADDAAADKSVNSTTQNMADTMASHDGGDTASQVPDIADPEARPVMQAQVVLDRQGFGPGVIDGKSGLSTENALNGFQEANGLTVTGKLDEPTKAKLAQWQAIPATRVVRVPAEWGTLAYQRTPKGPEEQSKLDRLGYQNLDEKLAERFHTTVDVLKALNPGGKPAGMKDGQDTGAPASPSATASATPPPLPSSTPSASASAASDSAPLPSVFAAGQLIRVPNIGVDRIAPGAVDDPDWQQTLQSLGVGTEQPKVAKVVVSKSKDTLKAYDEGGKLVALFTVTSGSSHDPLPLGNWKVNGRLAQPAVPLQPRPVLGCQGGRREGHAAAGSERSRRRGVDRPVEGALWHPRHVRAADDRPRPVARVRAADQLGRRTAGADGQPGHQGRVRGLTVALTAIDRALTIVVTATLTSAVWIVAGSTIMDRARHASGAAPAPTVAGATPGTAAPLSAGGAAVRAQAPRRQAGALVIPVRGKGPRDLTDTFTAARAGGERVHDAIDIMAAEGTPVIAAAPGKIEKLFLSQAGGNTIYVRSLDGRTIYYYAHLKSYAAGLAEGQAVIAGQPLGEVGHTGNASPDGPHLHFAILQTTPQAKWWEQNRAINPYPLLAAR